MMHGESPEKLKKARNIAKFRDMTRQLHSSTFRRSHALSLRHGVPLFLGGLTVALVIVCLPISFSAKAIVFVGAAILTEIIRFLAVSYVCRHETKTEKEYSIQYERQLFDYLQTYYAVDTKNMKYTMRPVNAYVIDADKVKKVWAHEFEFPQLPIANHLIKTPDLSEVLYFGSLTIDGEKVDNVAVQLTAERNIVLLNKGVEIPPLALVSG